MGNFYSVFIDSLVSTVSQKQFVQNNPLCHESIYFGVAYSAIVQYEEVEGAVNYWETFVIKQRDDTKKVKLMHKY